jgi:CDP-glucose 4,6-dehydratase
MTVLELVQQILRLMGREDVSPIVLDQAGKEIRRQALDCSKARRKLGWKPVFDLEGGLRETIAWYRDWHQAGVDHGQSR